MGFINFLKSWTTKQESNDKKMKVLFFNKPIHFNENEMNEQNVVYKLITYPQQRIYIGRTIMPLIQRIHDHIKDSRVDETNRLILLALQECESATISIEYKADNRSDLINAEKRIIKEYAHNILRKLPNGRQDLLGSYLLNMSGIK